MKGLIQQQIKDWAQFGSSKDRSVFWALLHSALTEAGRESVPPAILYQDTFSCAYRSSSQINLEMGILLGPITMADSIALGFSWFHPPPSIGFITGTLLWWSQDGYCSNSGNMLPHLYLGKGETLTFTNYHGFIGKSLYTCYWLKVA